MPINVSIRRWAPLVINSNLSAYATPDAAFLTDDASLHRKFAKQFADRQSVNHSAVEYVRGDAHANAVEGP